MLSMFNFGHIKLQTNSQKRRNNVRNFEKKIEVLESLIQVFSICIRCTYELYPIQIPFIVTVAV
jgi:hypothetical protein